MNLKPITAKDTEIVTVKELGDLAKVCSNNFAMIKGNHNAVVKEISSLKKKLFFSNLSLFVLTLLVYSDNSRIKILETKYDKLEYNRTFETEVENFVEKG